MRALRRRRNSRSPRHRPRRLWRWAPRLGVVAVVLPVVTFLLLDLAFPFPWHALERSAATAVRDRDGEPLRLFLPADEIWRLPVTYDELPPQLVAALVASEDRWFYRHPGVNPLAILRAAVTNLREGRVVSGASTLTMQIARMAEPKARTLDHKLIETFRALQLERRYSKRELLTIYLNMAPYGRNLEGVGAASRFYFGKEPAALSAGEIALLTALPRSPTYYDPTRYPESAERVRRDVLARLEGRGVVTAEEARAARRQPVPTALRPVPFAAPHFARRVAAGHRGRSVTTTLDRAVQRATEGVVARRIGELREQGLGNAAVVVIENETRAVRAWVGSAAFFDEAHQGQVDGVVARRSPGSTLKPFLYGRALDSGRWVPDSYLLDVPTDFAGYVAENYDGEYRGRVTLRTALAESLNAPAVRLLSDVGLPSFLDWLRSGGFVSLDGEAAQYGLPLILGAGEVSLLELANSYAHLADDGRVAPLTWLMPQARGEAAAPAGEEAWLSRGAARQVASLLKWVRRPDLPEAWNLARDVPAVSWKTGTSFGHRDAWAVGFTDRWTVAVWVGNFDGKASQGISGSRHAGPLFFDVHRALAGVETPAPTRATAPPAPVTRGLEVCAVSRHRPGPHCPQRERISGLAGRTRLPSCRMHRRIFVDRETGEWLAGRCLGERPHRAEVVEIPPAELVAWRLSRGLALTALPPVASDCAGGSAVAAPRIVSPDPRTPYRLRRGVPRDYQKIALVARGGSHLDPRRGQLYWFLNGKLLANGPATGERFWIPSKGQHRLVVVDDHGRADEVELRVE
ncbi:MAG: penicillin-binding protein 1C [Acidobacteriota bacterium]